jgi:hypothetical protein
VAWQKSLEFFAFLGRKAADHRSSLRLDSKWGLLKSSQAVRPVFADAHAAGVVSALVHVEFDSGRIDRAKRRA